jgi:preprotein translocase subunit SecG
MKDGGVQLETLILTIHIIACVSLIILVLLQSGHEGMGVIFGGSSSTLFGSTGAGGFLSKVTVGVAVVFLLTSLTFTYLGSQEHKGPAESVIFQKTTPTQTQNPVESSVPSEQQNPQSEQKQTGQTSQNNVSSENSQAE